MFLLMYILYEKNQIINSVFITFVTNKNCLYFRNRKKFTAAKSTKCCIYRLKNISNCRCWLHNTFILRLPLFLCFFLFLSFFFHMQSTSIFLPTDSLMIHFTCDSWMILLTKFTHSFVTKAVIFKTKSVIFETKTVIFETKTVIFETKLSFLKKNLSFLRQASNFEWKIIKKQYYW